MVFGLAGSRYKHVLQELLNRNIFVLAHYFVNKLDKLALESYYNEINDSLKFILLSREPTVDQNDNNDGRCQGVRASNVEGT